MSVIAVIGAQWGDEGKGKVIDLLAEKVKAVVRFSGGDNAGHTVINPYGEFKLHIVPSGVFYSHTTCIIGNGVVINPAVLLKEIDELNQRGVATGRLYISDRANLIMPYHIMLDGLEEEAKGEKALGTTRRGVGPAFTDKTARLGIRCGELLDKVAFMERLSTILEAKNKILSRVYGASPLNLQEVYKQYVQFGERLAPHITDTGMILDEILSRGEAALLEGAQGTLLDPDFGTYPYTTSSSPLAGGACLGAGLGPGRIDNVLGVFKAYCTRVGSGPMPTELNDATGDHIRECGHEYGTTTGRPRRCGWFDGVAARYSTRVNGFTEAVITRLDVLDSFPSLKICTAYRLSGQTITNFPSTVSVLEKCEPVYEELPGWPTTTRGISVFDKLPAEARRYVTRLEEIISCPVNLICVGPRREQTIFRNPVL